MDKTVKIRLIDGMEPKLCSMLINSLIQNILYNMQQIPFLYSTFSREIANTKEKRQKYEESDLYETKKPTPYKMLKAKNLCSKLEILYSNLENTFKNIEKELKSRRKISQICIVLGTNVRYPKYLFQINLPVLDYEKDFCSANASKIPKYLRSIHKSEYLATLFMKRFNLMNVFILIKVLEKDWIPNDWLLPRFDFKFPDKCEAVVFHLNCSYEDSSDDLAQPDHDQQAVEESFVWCQSKYDIAGFKDYKVDGVSVFEFVQN